MEGDVKRENLFSVNNNALITAQLLLLKNVGKIGKLKKV